MNPKILPSLWKTPEAFRERLGERAGRQRIMIEEGHLLIILHALPKPGISDREAVLFWRTPEGAWSSTGGGSAPAVLDELLAGFERAVDGLESRLTSAASAREFHDILRESAPLLRTVRNQHAALQEAREAVPSERRILLARDRSGEQLRALELLTHEAENSMQFLIAEDANANAAASERLAQTGHRLNLLVAVFLPLTAIGSALGMNLKHGFEDSSPALFWIVLGAGLFSGLVLKWLVAVSEKPRNTVPERKPAS